MMDTTGRAGFSPTRTSPASTGPDRPVGSKTAQESAREESREIPSRASGEAESGSPPAAAQRTTDPGTGARRTVTGPAWKPVAVRKVGAVGGEAGTSAGFSASGVG